MEHVTDLKLASFREQHSSGRDICHSTRKGLNRRAGYFRADGNSDVMPGRSRDVSAAED